MQGMIKGTMLGLALLAGATVQTSAQTVTALESQASTRVSTPEDIQAITKVTDDFQSALIKKDVKLLSSLMFSSNTLFNSPASDERIQSVRARYDVNFDGVGASGYPAFAEFIAKSSKPIQEKFSNIKITQDGHLAWVIFDYEFLADNIVQNYGVETWQMVKNAGKWKILSVVWSSHLPKK